MGFLDAFKATPRTCPNQGKLDYALDSFCLAGGIPCHVPAKGATMAALTHCEDFA
jgi:hypothetical protein